VRRCLSSPLSVICSLVLRTAKAWFLRRPRLALRIEGCQTREAQNAAVLMSSEGAGSPARLKTACLIWAHRTGLTGRWGLTGHSAQPQAHAATLCAGTGT